MTARQKAVAWRKLARRWEHAVVYGLSLCDQPMYALSRNGRADGICISINEAMREDLCRSLGPNRFGYWWPHNAVGRDCRVIACCLMAAITEAGDLP
jgi:hypothetical protein